MFILDVPGTPLDVPEKQVSLLFLKNLYLYKSANCLLPSLCF